MKLKKKYYLAVATRTTALGTRPVEIVIFNVYRYILYIQYSIGTVYIFKKYFHLIDSDPSGRKNGKIGNGTRRQEVKNN